MLAKHALYQLNYIPKTHAHLCKQNNTQSFLHVAQSPEALLRRRRSLSHPCFFEARQASQRSSSSESPMLFRSKRSFAKEPCENAFRHVYAVLYETHTNMNATKHGGGNGIRTHGIENYTLI